VPDRGGEQGVGRAEVVGDGGTRGVADAADDAVDAEHDDAEQVQVGVEVDYGLEAVGDVRQSFAGRGVGLTGMSAHRAAASAACCKVS
jgi:hypothetical protein